MKKVIVFFKDETVLCISAVLALVSCFLVPPDRAYLGYINVDTLGVLFCLMAVMAGFRKLGVFQRLASLLLGRLRSARALTLTLLALCFFGSMLITNDVALITFVPLALLISDMSGREGSLAYTVTLMTVAANLGSILTPIGNPQNLYIYSVSGMGLGEFVLTMLPYAAASAVLLVLCVLLGIKNTPVDVSMDDHPPKLAGLDLAWFSVLFVLCILSVAKLIPVTYLLIIIIIAVALRDWRLLLKVDYALLATFLCFFVFIGNMGRFDPFKNAVLSILSGHVLPVSLGLSQVISNVPAALLLGGFTDDWQALLTGVNLGGLGTLIASMASLISFKLLSRHSPQSKGRYLLIFTAVNLLFLAVLYPISFTA